MSATGDMVARLLKAKLSGTEIARQCGCSVSFVSHIKRYGTQASRNAALRARYVPRKRNGRPRRHSLDLTSSVIAAVDAGMTYREAADKFGLPSRSAVSGIMNRRPEARA